MMPDRWSLAHLLEQIEQADSVQNYAVRNALVVAAVADAMLRGWPAGFRVDPAEPEWPCAFISLPTGMVSWHLPQFAEPWDGHDTTEKYRRCREYIAGNLMRPHGMTHQAVAP